MIWIQIIEHSYTFWSKKWPRLEARIINKTTTKSVNQTYHRKIWNLFQFQTFTHYEQYHITETNPWTYCWNNRGMICPFEHFKIMRIGSWSVFFFILFYCMETWSGFKVENMNNENYLPWIKDEWIRDECHQNKSCINPVGSRDKS